MAQTEQLPSVGGPTTLTNAQVAASSTRPGQSDTPNTPPEEVLPRTFGRYELRRLLGRGGMGSVYLAHDGQLDREVALKIPRPFGEDPNLWRERFLTEARAAATLSHPNICPVHDVGEHDDRPFLTMAYIDGEPLSTLLRTAGRMPVAEAVEIVSAVARAMADAHARGIVHRDLKPGNVMIDRRGRPVVMDFGLALRTDAADDLRVTLTGVALGTPQYMPPEQAGGDADGVGPPADVYALGVMLFELVCGQTPFRGKTFGKLLAQIERDPPPVPSSINPNIPPALDGIILTALSKSPADRFPTAGELADVLEQFQAGRHDELADRFGAAVTAVRQADDRTRAYPVPPRKRRGWVPAVAAAFFTLLVLLAGAIYVTTDHGDLVVQFVDDKGNPIDKPTVDVKVNGQEVILDPNGKAVRVRAGENKLLKVTGEDFETASESFDLKRGGKNVVTVKLVPKGAVAKKPDPVDTNTGPTQKVPDTKKATPPDPVPFPKAKVLVELPGWHILTDATKDEMQTWLDERKKAKHSVVWLDAFLVGEEPVFCGVAALDDREWQWTALLGSKLKEVRDVAKAVDTTNNHILSLVAFPTNEGPALMSLWRKGRRGWNISPQTTPDKLEEQLGDMTKSGGVPCLVRKYRSGPDTPAFALYFENRTAKNAHSVDMPADELKRFLDRKRADGFRPVILSGYPEAERPVFAAVMEPNKEKWEWQTDTDLTAEALKGRADERAKSGFRPSCVTAHPWDGAVRYCVVWVKEPPKPVAYPKDKLLVNADGYETLVDATKEQMQTWLDEKKKAMHSVLWLDAYQVGDKPVFCAVVALDDRKTEWTAMLSVPLAEMPPPAMRKKLNTESNCVRSLSGYFDGENLSSTLLWHAGVKRWIYRPCDTGLGVVETDLADAAKQVSVSAVLVRPIPTASGAVLSGYYAEMRVGSSTRYKLGLTAAGLTPHLDAQRKDGYRPVALAAAGGSDGVVFGVVTEKAPEKLEWATDTGLPADKLAEAAKERAKAGFHPDTVTAYGWDGAVRYCVVWVKDPPKDEKKDPSKKEEEKPAEKK